MFTLLALAAAAVAAAIADGYGSRIARSYGPLRPVVIARLALPAGEPLGPDALEEALEVRRVPLRFIPPGTLSGGSQALGLEPRADIAPGSYLTATSLRPPVPPRARSPRLPAGRRPVQIAVAGAGSLLAAAAGRGDALVDAVVTSEPTGAGPGRTYIAAAGVPLLALHRSGAGQAPAGPATATLGLTRGEALELIGAQSFARQVTLMAGAGG